MDTQTKSLWSHILGLAVDGELKGTELPTIPCDMVTWKAWKEEHPKSTVLNLKRSSKNYTKEFYQKPDRFVLGFTGKFGMHHCSFKSLSERRVVNVDARGKPLLISFDPESTSARIFVRQFESETLSFEATADGKLRDTKTKSVWSRAGVCVDGPMKGKHLDAHVGIVSYARVWKKFHPDSREVIFPDEK